MPTPYNTVEITEECRIPAFNSTLQGQGGCGSQNNVRNAREILAQATSVAWYEPKQVSVCKDVRRFTGRTGSIPKFHFTPRYASTVTTESFLLRRADGTNGINTFDQHGHVAGYPNCQVVIDLIDISGPKTAVWNTVTHIPPVGINTYSVSSISESDIVNASSRLQMDLAKDSLTSYDALTDIAQLGEIPGLVSSIASDVKTILNTLRGKFSMNDLRRMLHIRPKDLLKHPEKIFRAFGSRWLEYRYGIMPLVYSYQDIVKTLHRGIDNRIRKNTTLTPKATGVSLPSASTTYKWTEVTGSVKLSGTVFQFFEFASEAKLAGLGFNPFVTAWELIPYSFVIDWFVNIGDYIAVKTSRSIAKQQWACISRRDNYSVNTYVHFPNADKTVTFGNALSVPWWGNSPPATPSRVIKNPECSMLTSRITYDTYNRDVIPLYDVQLQFNPSLNWRRLTDAAALSQTGLKSVWKLITNFAGAKH